MNAYHYTCDYRPAHAMQLPEGWELIERGTRGEYPLRRDLPEGETRFGVIRYRRPLSERELHDFELRAV